MKNLFKVYLSDEKWLIHEKGCPHREGDRQMVYETLFSLGNGYIGSRGILEELPEGCFPGTFIAGVFDKSEGQTVEIVNVPNPLDFKITVNGDKLSMNNHSRTLDMQKGVLFRHTVFSNKQNQRFDYQSLRFFSAFDKHILVMHACITPLDKSADISVYDSIDAGVTNSVQAIGEEVKHFKILKKESIKDKICYVCCRTNDRKILLNYGSLLKAYKAGIQIKPRMQIFSSKDNITRKVELDIKKGDTICFTRIVCVYTSRDISPAKIKYATIQNLQKCASHGFKKLFQDHVKCWLKKWQFANISIKGDKRADKAVRFNIYHLLICGNEDDDRTSIGAKALTGEWYKGHVFWDTEIYILPFFIYTDPKIARNILLYRYYGLKKAKLNAKIQGYLGALFPWESADTGEETTPKYHPDFDGTIKRVRTMEMEHHIVGDVAYAVYHYYLATGDEKFMLDYGAKIVFETARFWASRVEYNDNIDRYEIKNVIGPDEFHEGVNNNVYTNYFARWNLLYACELYQKFKQSRKHPIPASELKKWEETANKIFLPDTNLIEEFDGYFKKRDVPITRWDDNLLPLYPDGVTVQDLGKLQLLKQPDVVLLLYLFSDKFNLEQKKANFHYYERRTMHKSSLSPCIHVISGLDIGDNKKAYRYFATTAELDLKNNQKNAEKGIHAATLGGTWQAVINGFAGMRIREGILSFNPYLPQHWQEIKFNIKWHGFDLNVKICRNSIHMFFASYKKSDCISMNFYDRLYEIKANKQHKISFSL